MKSIRVLGLAAIAALALVAFPSAASATGGLEADSYPVTYTGVALNSVFSIAGTEAGTTCASTLGGEAKKRTGTLATVANWHCGSGKGYDLNPNGCKLELHAGSESTIDIGPSSCGPITGLIVGACQFSISAQTGLPATYENVVEGGVEKVKVKLSTTLKTSSEACGKLQFDATWTVSGFNPSAEPVGIRAKTGFNGLFIGGKKSENEAEQPKFEAENYPVQIAGGLDPSTSFVFSMPAGSFKVNCGSALLSSEAAKATTSLAVGATFGSCLYGESAVTVAMNSCYLTENVTNSGPPYVGKMGIACAKEGDAIELTTSGCVAKITAQSPSTGGVYYDNQGSGSARSIHAWATSTNVTYTYTSGICTITGKSHSDATLTGKFTLYGI